MQKGNRVAGVSYARWLLLSLCLTVMHVTAVELIVFSCLTWCHCACKHVCVSRARNKLLNLCMYDRVSFLPLYASDLTRY